MESQSKIYNIQQIIVNEHFAKAHRQFVSMNVLLLFIKLIILEQ
jgi:hypothetical protein